jgi:mono/diheme cytochrome c family protein
VIHAAGARRMSKLPGSLVAQVLCALVSIASVAHAETDAAKVETGATVYGNYCSNCHGEGLQNTSGGVTFDLRRLRTEDRDRFLNVVLDGKRQMPPWRGALDMAQIDAIWTYIRSIVDR